MLNCKKLLTLTTDPAIIFEAISKSNKVEALPDKSGIRRKNNSPLPKFEGDILKKIKTNDGGENSTSNANPVYEVKEPYKTYNIY